MPRPARVSPDRILGAAAAEFAARGFAGARVDRIAAQSRRERRRITEMGYSAGNGIHFIVGGNCA